MKSLQGETLCKLFLFVVEFDFFDKVQCGSGRMAKDTRQNAGYLKKGDMQKGLPLTYFYFSS
jgi:hypothetical protein